MAGGGSGEGRGGSAGAAGVVTGAAPTLACPHLPILCSLLYAPCCTLILLAQAWCSASLLMALPLYCSCTACTGESYLNFMGNEFGHPEWIDFPRDDT